MDVWVRMGWRRLRVTRVAAREAALDCRPAVCRAAERTLQMAALAHCPLAAASEAAASRLSPPTARLRGQLWRMARRGHRRAARGLLFPNWAEAIRRQ